MPETINLIPQEERVSQTKTKVVKVSTWLAIGVLIIIVGVSGYFYYKSYNLKQELSSMEASVASLRTEINKLSDIEINARNLFKKSNTLSTIFESRLYYSKLLKELEASVPSTINIKTFGLSKDMTISISGDADDYNSVQDFSNRLLARDVFSQVQLNSVGLESQKDKVNFFILVTYKEELLHD